MADEVETLKRELEVLRLQLEQERKKNAAVQGGAGSKPERVAPRDGSANSKRPGGGASKTAIAAAPSSTEPHVCYVQHAAVGARHGKWWLRDRQVLSRAEPDEDGGAALKVRETWVWIGRTVVLDKIVRLGEEKKQDEECSEGEEAAKTEVVKEPDATTGLQSAKGSVGLEEDAAPPGEPTTGEQPSGAAETSEASTTTGEEALDSKGADELALPKADDDVRESSTPPSDPPPSSAATAEASDAPCST